MIKKQGVKKIIDEKYDEESEKMDEVIEAINRAIPLMIADFNKEGSDNINGKFRLVKLESVKYFDSEKIKIKESYEEEEDKIKDFIETDYCVKLEGLFSRLDDT